jgi:hypothetical protein
VLEDGGFSIEPIYWLNRAQPALFGGAQSAQSGVFASQSYPGHANPAMRGEIAIPTGHSNTLRLSYFRILGHANSTETQSPTLFGESYAAGDYLISSYNVQIAKLSWDYLSYTWRKSPGNIHFKTLYELQYVNVATSFFAPFVAQTTDSSGNVNDNTAAGSKHIILPALGAEFEQAIGKRFRWEVKGSGFGIPHHSVIADVQADIAVRVSKFELIAGEKWYHFKTSPQADQYFTDTLSGVFGGIRYYLSNETK